jgi:hypothetical protein
MDSQVDCACRPLRDRDDRAVLRGDTLLLTFNMADGTVLLIFNRSCLHSRPKFLTARST